MTIPIRDLKNTTELSRLCHANTEPIVITKNGYDDMVIMSSECFERHKVGFYRSLYANAGSPTDLIKTGISNQASLAVAEDTVAYEAEKKDEPVYTIPQIKQILDPILERHEVKNCTLFGSYAKGEACSISDIDLMIDCKERGLKFFGILEEVCSSFDVPIDLIHIVDVKKGTDFEREIKTTGIILYSR